MSLLSNLFNVSPSEGSARPPRTLLIGIARTVRQMNRVIREAETPLEIIGCALLQPQHRAGAVGLQVLGTVDQLDMLVKLHRVERVLISVPRVMRGSADALAVRCKEFEIPARIVPPIDELLNEEPGGRASSDPMDTEALLDRPPRRLDEGAIGRLLGGKRVLVTGAGGSIGSELARIVVRYEPAELLLMERGENNLFQILHELRHAAPDLPIRGLLHDVARDERTLALCRQHEPQIVFHAAAHKHVPMMEDHPREAVENNFFGTRAIADAAHAVGAERFVMISTDKAVNPTSVMGATKRLAERYIQHLNGQSGTAFTMVRFGNVLGSAGSVLPIWSRQLAEGQPLTVTDRRMTRYFMTIPEAAALVIQAATLDESEGQIMVLDMGEPVRIVDLARRFIARHGLAPERDVPIVFTGIRPGEKLFEELAYDSEKMQRTAHESVHVHLSRPPEDEEMVRLIDVFRSLRHSDDRGRILSALREAVPEMHAPPTEVPATAAAGDPLSRSA